jgi:hypothetical protein
MKALLKNVEKRSKVPVLSCVWVKQGFLISSDLDMECRIPANGLEHGVYNAALLAKGISQKVDISLDDTPESIACGEVLKQIENIYYDDLEFVSKAVSHEETRYYLNGIYFDGQNMVATDGHRLHCKPLFADNCHGFGDNNPILPRRAVNLILSAMKEYKASHVDIAFTDSKAIVTIGEFMLVSKLIDGTFPDYKKVIPDMTSPIMQSPFDYSCFKKALPLAKIQSRNYGVKYSAESKAWESFGKSPLPLPDIAGFFLCSDAPAYSVGFNCQYLAETGLIGSLIGKGSTDPHLIKCGHSHKFAVIMPIRV